MTFTKVLITHLKAFQQINSQSYRGNSSVDLCSIGALCVWILGCGHLQQAHAKRIHIDSLVIVLLVHLRSHKLGCTLNANRREGGVEFENKLSNLLKGEKGGKTPQQTKIIC